MTLVAVIGLSLLIILHEAGHYLVARLCSMRVLRFSIGFGPALLHRKVGETDWQFAAIPLGGYVQIDGMGPTEDEDGKPAPMGEHSFRARPVWQRILVIFAGPATNWLLAAFFIFILAFTIGFNQYDDSSTAIGEVVEKTPAAAAGLAVGDVIEEIDGEPVEGWSQMVSLIQARPGKTTPFVITRDGAELTITVTPADKGGVGRIGVGPLPTTIHLGFFGAIGAGVTSAADMTNRQASLLWGLIVGSQEGQLSGLPGIFKMVSAQAKRGVRRFFETLAWLSIGLFLLNLAPIPALDGGRLVFLGVEVVRGKPVDARIEGVIHAGGFILLFGLMIFVSVRDLL